MIRCEKEHLTLQLDCRISCFSELIIGRPGHTDLLMLFRVDREETVYTRNVYNSNVFLFFFNKSKCLI